MTSYEYLALASEHHRFAALLAAIFIATLCVYLVAAWKIGAALTRRQFFLLHTMYLLWQTNIAFVAVVSLSVAARCLGLAGESGAALGWQVAPWILPSSAVLYGSMLVLSLAFMASLRRQRPADGAS